MGCFVYENTVFRRVGDGTVTNVKFYFVDVYWLVNTGDVPVAGTTTVTPRVNGRIIRHQCQ